MTEVVYARVPEGLKKRATAYADRRGATLTSAIVDLLERGLNAEDSGRKLVQYEGQIERLASDKAQAESALNAALAELNAVQALAQRTQQPVGTCPEPGCFAPFTGADLFAKGVCPNGHPLSSLLTFERPKTAASAGQTTVGLNDREVLLLLGALGAVIGLALLTKGAA
jgi:hypothetical protein